MWQKWLGHQTWTNGSAETKENRHPRSRWDYLPFLQQDFSTGTQYNQVRSTSINRLASTCRAQCPVTWPHQGVTYKPEEHQSIPVGVPVLPGNKSKSLANLYCGAFPSGSGSFPSSSSFSRTLIFMDE